MRYSTTVITLGSLPQPTGPYLVGTYKQKLFDQNRPEIHFKNGRLIPIQIYSPTTKGKHTLYPKRLEENAPQVFSQIFYHVYSSETDISCLNQRKHPIIFLNHGLTAAMTDYSAIAEDLASNGYIVIAIQHQLNTDADPIDEPASWKNHSLSLQAKVIDNILYVFEWLQSNQSTLFKGRIDCQKVGFIGHSLGSNALLLLVSRRGVFFNGKQIQTLLPHKETQTVKECIISLDFDASFSYPRHNKYPMLFIFSEERKELLKDSGIFEDLTNLKHTVKFITPSKHISFFDQGYIHPIDTAFPDLFYFKKEDHHRKIFFDNLRKNIKDYLYENLQKTKE